MAEKGSGQLTRTGRLLAENRWIVPTLGLIGVVGTFALAGLVPSLILLAVLATLAIVALALSWRKADDRVKALEAALAARAGDDDEELPVSAGELGNHRSESAVAEPPDETADDAEPNGEDDPDAPMWDALTTAVRERDVAESRRLSDQYIGTAKDDSERIERQAFALRVRGWAGDSTALPELEELVKAHPSHPYPPLALAASLEGLKEFARAIDILELAAGTVEKSVHLLAEAARIARRARNFTMAQALAERAVVVATLPKEKAEAHKALGWALWDGGDQSAAFTNWESSLHLNPADDDLRFAAAYRYSDAGVPELALLHYEVVVSSDISHGSAQNNLGVVLERLGMELAAARNYRAAAERGESLPASNLASKLLSAGCVDEARDWLAKGREAEVVDPRVAQVEAHLAAALEDEETTLTNVRHRADELRRIHSDGLLPTDVPVGAWIIESKEIELQPDGDSASSAPTSWGTRYRFERSSRGLEVTSRSSQYASAQTGLGCLRGGVLRFYLASSESGGATTVVNGYPAPES
ncbi:MAG: hypothetical protein OSA99_05615 [Acidimicrobiales bacterium]|nr:hypothetical protein [Acidimicrobiales bacterium]